MAAPWNIHTPDWFRDARALASAFARLIAAPAQCAALVPSVSYGIAAAARNLPVQAGENLVVIDQEYPSNYYSWRRLADANGAEIRSVRPAGNASLTDAIVTAIDRRTAVVAVAHCRWTDGCLVDLPRVGEAARRHGIGAAESAEERRVGPPDTSPDPPPPPEQLTLL